VFAPIPVVPQAAFGRGPALYLEPQRGDVCGIGDKADFDDAALIGHEIEHDLHLAAWREDEAWLTVDQRWTRGLSPASERVRDSGTAPDLPP